MRKVEPSRHISGGQVISRGENSFAYSRTILKPPGILEQILDWSKQELQEDWRWSLVEISNYDRPGKYVFYFDSEQDYVAFLMKWS